MKTMLFVLMLSWACVGSSLAQEAVSAAKPSKVRSLTELRGDDGKKVGMVLRLTLPVAANLPWNTAEVFERYERMSATNAGALYSPGEGWLKEPVLIEVDGVLYRSSEKFSPRGIEGSFFGPYATFDVTVVLPDLPSGQKEMAVYKFSEKVNSLQDLKGTPAEDHVVLPPPTERRAVSPKALWMDVNIQPDQSETVYLQLNWIEKDPNNPENAVAVVLPESVEAVRIGATDASSIKVSEKMVGDSARTVLVLSFPKKINPDDPIFIKLKGFKATVAIGKAVKIEPTH
jgi:hypothetical protein